MVCCACRPSASAAICRRNACSLQRSTAQPDHPVVPARSASGFWSQPRLPDSQLCHFNAMSSLHLSPCEHFVCFLQLDYFCQVAYVLVCHAHSLPDIPHCRAAPLTHGTANSGRAGAKNEYPDSRSPPADSCSWPDSHPDWQPLWLPLLQLKRQQGVPCTPATHAGTSPHAGHRAFMATAS